MPPKADVKTCAAQLQSFFVNAGAHPVEADILQPAATLLDLYGEDIRARAYVTQDPLRGEQMLRPDFTVPVVQMHMHDGAEPARYTYSGEVFRRQETDPDRANEYMQVGYEVFDRDIAKADAEVFALFSKALSPLGLRAATGDIGLLITAVQGLRTTDKRKAALMRHIWRPRRFRTLLERYSGRIPVPQTRQNLLVAADPMSEGGPLIGLRKRTEIAARITALHEDAAADPISAIEVDMLEELMALRETASNALAALRDIMVDLPAITPAVDQLDRRLSEMNSQGINVDTLEFEASYGRTTLEYYDGFVFGFYSDARPDLPPVATGGRYDALTRVLGNGREIPAVGGMIRPGIVTELGSLS
ncbi:ATP phosphoribosyltransferase regulatory subunit [Parasulfitobacter algicola]|uniref:Histidine--tRNA ligase n=1 Tax=Parasulfitobacter algicola TaxID=2614809 RepID=A0ABX2IY29_9RHOB|nr:ATP phosphoribosyltransferase regulatory subunit [Sulfitobacter algicola]NSX55103.1 ATP phosphoribosyltransferase regulatory subunit [Sulfitobacter algicola]